MPRRSLAYCSSLEHPFSKSFGIWAKVFVDFYLGNISDAANRVEETLSFIKEHGLILFSFVVKLLLGAVYVKQGKGIEGLAMIKENHRLAETANSIVVIPLALSLFLEACLDNGSIEEGLKAVESEMENHSITGQRWFEAEIRRLYGELILADDPNRVAEAQAEFHLAIEISQRQHAKSLELRAVISLARLWQQQGKIKQAYVRLSEVYKWFTEGFDTQDLIEARALLQELEG